jgi:hypothetical protein
MHFHGTATVMHTKIHETISRIKHKHKENTRISQTILLVATRPSECRELREHKGTRLKRISPLLTF